MLVDIGVDGALAVTLGTAVVGSACGAGVEGGPHKLKVGISSSSIIWPRSSSASLSTSGAWPFFWRESLASGSSSCIPASSSSFSGSSGRVLEGKKVAEKAAKMFGAFLGLNGEEGSDSDPSCIFITESFLESWKEKLVGAVSDPFSDEFCWLFCR